MSAKDFAPLIYLDHAATTPCLPSVVAAMEPFWSSCYGNPSSKNHAAGQQAMQAVERARNQIAGVVGALPEELIWTSGVTEANNLAILGHMQHVQSQRAGPVHVITTATEHKSVLSVFNHLRKMQHVEVSLVPVDSQGRVSVDQITQMLRPDTALVSMMWANNETGVIHPVREVALECDRRGIAFHTDAAQVLGKGDFDVRIPGLTLATFGAHKLGGPKGIGALYAKGLGKATLISPLIHGGGQEMGLRSGTLNVPLIVGFGEAVAAVNKEATQITHQLAHHRQALESGILQAVPDARINSAGAERISHISSITFPPLRITEVVEKLQRVCCSSGSACASHDGQPSHVLYHMGIREQAAKNTLRFSVGMTTTNGEVQAAINEISHLVRTHRQTRH